MPYSFFQKKFQKSAQGFTLVETLVAISIIMVGISATFSVVQFGLSSTIAVKDRITSGFLAQEALEAVRNVKDSNLLAQNSTGGSVNVPPWLDLVSAPCVTSCEYNFGSSASPFTACVAEECRLYIGTDGRYTSASNGVASRFTRYITVQELASNPSYPDHKEARVTVTITWPGRTLTVTENITNWFAP